MAGRHFRLRFWSAERRKQRRHKGCPSDGFIRRAAFVCVRLSRGEFGFVLSSAPFSPVQSSPLHFSRAQLGSAPSALMEIGMEICFMAASRAEESGAQLVAEPLH